MQPTAKLRFVDRKVPMHPFYKDASTGGTAYHIYRVLQQWWEHTEWNASGEWRDVPIEEENK
jgi:hypothetical protein